jgi:hypothetical protein
MQKRTPQKRYPNMTMLSSDPFIPLSRSFPRGSSPIHWSFVVSCAVVSALLSAFMRAINMSRPVPTGLIVHSRDPATTVNAILALVFFRRFFFRGRLCHLLVRQLAFRITDSVAGFFHDSLQSFGRCGEDFPVRGSEHHQLLEGFRIVLFGIRFLSASIKFDLFPSLVRLRWRGWRRRCLRRGRRILARNA